MEETAAADQESRRRSSDADECEGDLEVGSDLPAGGDGDGEHGLPSGCRQWDSGSRTYSCGTHM